MKIVINRCFGGFGLSDAAIAEYIRRGGAAIEELRKGRHPDFALKRDDKVIVAIVEEMGEAAWSPYAELKVVDIPDDVDWEIDDYDGVERVRERSREWY